ncbi:ethionine resistance protein [Coemansia sp. RSA 1200]|nr:ethionine resistance protein [Coemansia sp. RSA 1200]
MASTSNNNQRKGIEEIDERLINNNEATPLLHTSLSELDIAIFKNDTTESSFVQPNETSLTTLTLLLEMSFYTTNFLVVGRLGAKELGAMSLALTFQAVLAMGPTFGLVSAMDTFCSTAFTASRDKTLVGFHFQRGIIALVAHFILILSVLPFALFEATKRFMQAQGIMRAATIITIVVAPIHWINCYVFVLSDTYGLGFIGAPIVNAVSNWALLVGILLYIRRSPATEAWGGWKLGAFRNMWDYYRLAIPAIFTTCSGWICFELLALGASYFGAYQLAGNGIMLNTLQFLYHFSNGVGYGASPRIGNLIGAAKPRQACIAAHVSILMSTLIGIMCTLFVLLCGNWIASIYTDDHNVVYETLKLGPVACILIVGDDLNAVLEAILRGLGRQNISANALVFGFYMCAVPLAIYLAYIKNMETIGLWWGACVAHMVDERVEPNETTPLLQVRLSEIDLVIAKNDTTEPYIHASKRELKWMASNSSLVILNLVLQTSFFFVNVVSVGQLGAKKLAAMSLAVTFHNIIVMSPIFGLLSAMDTFCSTAYTASRDKTLVGFHYQRGIVAVCTHFILVSPILWNAESIMLRLGQDPEIAHLSGLYLRIQIISLLPSSLYETTKRYLQAQGIMHAAAIVVAVVAPIQWISSFMLVRSTRFGLGFIGAPIVNMIANTLLLSGVLLFVRYSRAAESWGGWNMSVFGTMWEYYKFAIPAVITICAEWVGFELLVLGASYFGAYQLAANAIMLNTVGLIFAFSNGLGYSTGSRIGNLMGNAKPRQARIAAYMSLLATTFIGIMGTLFIWVYGVQWTSIYTPDPLVAIEVAKLVPVACVFMISDCLSPILAAVSRGLGHQKENANIFLLGFYACAFPIATYLGYVEHLETLGLWWGFCIGVIAVCILQAVYLFVWVNWRDEVCLCVIRLLKNSSGAVRNIDSE